MKKHLNLFLCLVISLILLGGCTNYEDSDQGPAKTQAETGSSSSTEARPGIVTIYDTVNNFEGVTMRVKEGSVTANGLSVIFSNKSSHECIYGEHFGLEKKTTGSWYQIPVVIDGNYGFNHIGYPLAPGENAELAVDWEWLYASLAPGDYRIIKDIADFRATGDYDKYYLAAEFTIN
ncbi:MAG: hypothetical protein GX119_02250 [Syntrophomonadaceae bacterium]|nr:hypothetical protein [Syntrophomonadaceae bacterium]